jgi:hypothetical protein
VAARDGDKADGPAPRQRHHEDQPSLKAIAAVYVPTTGEEVSMTTALTIGTPTDLPALRELGQLLVASRFFKDAGDIAPAITKILLGRELGLAPMASMLEIHVIEGKPSIGSHLIAKGIKRSKRYDYRVLEHTDEKCRIQFLERQENGTKEELGVFEYTIGDAKKAGLAHKKNWQQPKPMLFARAIGQGYRTHCPDALDLLVYAEGELEEPEAVTVEHTPAPADGKPASKARVLQGGKLPVQEAFPGKVVDVVGTRPSQASPAQTSSPSGGQTSSPPLTAPAGASTSAPASAAAEPAAPAPAAPAASSAGNPLADAARAEGPSPGPSLPASAASTVSSTSSAAPTTPTGEPAPRRRARRD